MATWTFTEKHERVGLVTNQPGKYDPSRPHASTIVCNQDECLLKAKQWVAGLTNETAVFVPDEERPC